MTAEPENIDPTRGGYVCEHLLAPDTNADIYIQFTGIGVNYNLICNQCRENLSNLSTNLRAASPDEFEKTDRYREGIIGQPQILERATKLSFEEQHVMLKLPANGQIRSIAPRPTATSSQWIAVLSSREVMLLDLTQRSTTTLMTIAASDFEISDKVALHVAPDGRFAAIVNDYQQYGIVVDLNTGKVTLKLDRQSYHPEQTQFPVAFFEHRGKTLVVHGTNWNRLDISDAATGKMVTGRISVEYENNRRPEHYLDYFHALPVISPDAEWIVEDGWVWQPFGMTRLWSLRRWLTEMMWESEDGTSVRYLTQRGYYWNGALCWLDHKTLAVWGFGDDDLWIIPAIQIFDAATGKRRRWFAGPNARTLYFDTYLFAVSSEGTEVWDVNTGERLHHNAGLVPMSFHPGTHEFLSVLENGELLLSRLVDPGKA